MEPVELHRSQGQRQLVRNERAVMVVDCQALGMIGVVRSLGRAGYIVHGASSDPQALGFHSRFCAVAARHPPYASASFLAWLESYVHANRIAAIVPSEGFLHAIATVADQYRSLIPDGVAMADWQTCLSKVSTQLRLLQLDAQCPHLPPGGVVVDDASVPSEVELGQHAAPYYLKADAGQGIGHSDALVLLCPDRASLLHNMALTRPRYRAMLWQSFAPGMKVGVSLWRHGDAFLAENMVLGLHMHPHTGGMMSLRKTFWHEAILADAKRKFCQLNWQGVAMMEYKWNPETDEFWFIEINARYWGYLHLDLFSGKDFPRLQVDAHFGEVQSDRGAARRQLSCRNAVPGEIDYLASLLKDATVPRMRKLAQALGFGLLFLHPTMRADLLFPSDRGLYWRAWRRFIASRLGFGRPEAAKHP